MGRPSKYPLEFRREAVELYLSSDRPRCRVAESLGVSDGSLAAWVRPLHNNLDQDQGLSSTWTNQRGPLILAEGP